MGQHKTVLAQEEPAATQNKAAAAQNEPAAAQNEPAAGQNATGSVDGAASTENEARLQFSFDRTPWRDVIEWVADEADLALHVGELPTGSFTYSDNREFTPEEAIDRINLFLLPQGFTLVRSGKLLSVLNLGDPRSMQQLDTLAKTVTVEELSKLKPQEVVKCIFPLTAAKAEDAAEELSALTLMTTPVVFAKTNRLMITDTVRNLQNVKSILDGFEPSALSGDLAMKNFSLQHADAEDILQVARPHLGLATGEMIGIDVSLSADLQGKNIFVTGVEDKIKLIEGLINELDKPSKGKRAADEAVLKSHPVQGGNVETVYNVLVTLLAGEEMRLSMDETAGTIVALASPEIQNEIAQTVTQLQATEAEFAVIPLKSVDPYFAVSLIEEMLDLTDPLFTTSDEERDRDRRNKTPRIEKPKIDADPGNMRLFVRGKKHQIEQIRKIVAELDASASLGATDRNEQFRVVPYKGQQAEKILTTAAKFWREDNAIIVFPSAVKAPQTSNERVVAEQASRGAEVRPATSQPPAAEGRLLAGNVQSNEPPIRCQVTSRGLFVQCEDTEALDRFLALLQVIAGPIASTPSPPVVFYLKYARPNDALQMLAELLDGGETADETESGTLVNAYVTSSGSSLFGSFVSSRQGLMTMTAGTMTVVADSRLNRLIVQGTASDVERVEQYLKIVDKDKGPTAVETRGKTRIIELQHTRATVVAAMIREAFAGRVNAAAATGRQDQQGGRRPPGEEQRRRDDAPPTELTRRGRDGGSDGRGESAERGGETRGSAPPRRSGNQPARDLEPKMAIAVHEPSNSLIVTAPDQLFEEVEALVQQIDVRSVQVIEVIQAEGARGIESRLRQLLGDEASSRNRPASSSSSSTTPPPSRPNPAGRSTPPTDFRGSGRGR